MGGQESNPDTWDLPLRNPAHIPAARCQEAETSGVDDGRIALALGRDEGSEVFPAMHPGGYTGSRRGKAGVCSGSTLNRNEAWTKEGYSSSGRSTTLT